MNVLRVEVRSLVNLGKIIYWLKTVVERGELHAKISFDYKQEAIKHSRYQSLGSTQCSGRLYVGKHGS